MIDAAGKSLAYFTQNFGPYQHRSLRIVEFPGHVRDATSFPGMIAVSEATGSTPASMARRRSIFRSTSRRTRSRTSGGVSNWSAPTCRWAMLHETLAQYSALMVMEAEFGRQGMRRVLAYEQDWYPRSLR